MASVFLGTVLMWDIICVVFWGHGSWEMGACKKQICRPPGVYVTCENERGELRLPMKEKDEMQMMKVAIIEKHLGNLSVDRLQVPHWQDGGGAVVAGRRGEKSRGRGVSERARRYRETEKVGREWHRSLCSLNEVFFLFFRVCVVALGVDDGCVGVRRVVRPFGLVCQVRSWGSGEKNKKQNPTKL